MSRIGKKPIKVPEKVNVKIKEDTITIKGPKGELNWNVPPSIQVTVTDGSIIVARANDSKIEKSLHGLARSIISNMVTGVSVGFQRVLEIIGVGYRAQVAGNKLMLTLGYSHPIEYPLPEGISAAVDQKQVNITLTGVDKQKLGQVAASLKALRPPDAYKGKGVRYSGERLKLKAGKAAKK
jgi:large subunit ribosomal protein L6